MKRLLLGLTLLVTATAASAEWTISSGNDEYIQYVDTATIRRNGNLVKMWILSDYKEVEVFAGKSFLSIRALSEYDCKDEKIRVLSENGFSGQMGKGRISYNDEDPKKWFAVAPGTNGEAQWKIACGK